jgi:hypothetical protein
VAVCQSATNLTGRNPDEAAAEHDSGSGADLVQGRIPCFLAHARYADTPIEFRSEVAAGEDDAEIFAIDSLACLIHSARIASADCFCAAAPEIESAKNVGMSTAYPNCTFGFVMVVSVMVIVIVMIFSLNAYLDCTSRLHRQIR